MSPAFYRHTWAEIQLDAIANNIKGIRKLLPADTKIMAVVKANGYGHGALETARIALVSGAEFLAVALLDEAIFLRRNGIRAPILVLGYCPVEYVHIAASFDIALTVYQKEWLLQAEKNLNAKTLKVHLKLDTGMGRIGVTDEKELLEIIQILDNSSRLIFDGVFTHFAKADSLDISYYNQQLSRFEYLLNLIKKRPQWVHAANSAAALLQKRSLYNLVRCGIVIYGLSPSDEMKSRLPFRLQEVFLCIQLAHVKKWERGQKSVTAVRYTAPEDEWIGTLPIGYADGWLRALARAGGFD